LLAVTSTRCGSSAAGLLPVLPPLAGGFGWVCAIADRPKVMLAARTDHRCAPCPQAEVARGRMQIVFVMLFSMLLQRAAQRSVRHRFAQAW
jgi:hypothetical protein